MDDSAPPPDPIDALKAREAWLVEELARVRRALADLRGESYRLHEPNQSGKTAGNSMNAVNRAQHTRGAKASPRTKPLIDACLARGLNLRMLAERLRATTDHKKISHSHLSQAVNGVLPIDRAVAAKIEELTGYEATVANWPKLRSE